MATKAEMEARVRKQDSRRQLVKANADLRALGCQHTLDTPEAGAWLAGYSAGLRFAKESVQ
jgi:hypothetical protein